MRIVGLRYCRGCLTCFIEFNRKCIELYYLAISDYNNINNIVERLSYRRHFLKGIPLGGATELCPCQRHSPTGTPSELRSYRRRDPYGRRIVFNKTLRFKSFYNLIYFPLFCRKFKETRLNFCSLDLCIHRFYGKFSFNSDTTNISQL